MCDNCSLLSILAGASATPIDLSASVGLHYLKYTFGHMQDGRENQQYIDHLVTTLSTVRSRLEVVVWVIQTVDVGWLHQWNLTSLAAVFHTSALASTILRLEISLLEEDFHDFCLNPPSNFELMVKQERFQFTPVRHQGSPWWFR